MKSFDTHILDCTLRDGGYVNDWLWGFLRSKAIINNLVHAGIDMVEVGFLRDIDNYDENITVCNTIEELNRLLPKNYENTVFTAMTMCGDYDIRKLSPYSGKGISVIRITAHDYDIDDGIALAKRIQELGYEVSMNPINIMGYTTEEVIGIINKVNKINPYQFSIVDTFGSMKLRHMKKLVLLADSELNSSIKLGLHLHENMSSATLLAQSFLDIRVQRDITIDASLMGVGRDPGNLPIELIADHLNDDFGEKYKIEFLLDSIESHVLEMHGNTAWGYNPAYFLSARHNLHRNYSEFYLAKGDLTQRNINDIFQRFSEKKKTVFDKIYAENLYSEFKEDNIDDTEDRFKLGKELSERDILLLAPGATLTTRKDKIISHIETNNPIVISVNFLPNDYDVDFAFFGNARRYQMFDSKICKIITTSNIKAENADYRLNYVNLFDSNDKYVNSMPLFLRFLLSIGIKRVSIAGADGFVKAGQNYFDEYLWSKNENNSDINDYTGKLLKNIGLELDYITPSLYENADMEVL